VSTRFACAILFASCTSTDAPARDAPLESPPKDEVAMHEAPPQCSATDGRLEIAARLDPEVFVDRIPMRRLRVTLRNVSDAPLRVLWIRPEPVRAGTSSFLVSVPEGRPLFVPEPRPHGYLIGEDDFVLLAPGQRFEAEQSFSIDPMQPGAGTQTARLPGFVAGAAAKISWTFQNATTRFPGGIQTLDGPTKPLFGGGDVPDLWTGKLNCSFEWIIPP
jgi:hypothetical protein